MVLQTQVMQECQCEGAQEGRGFVDRRSSRQVRNQQVFTLVEMLVVIGVIVVLAAVIVPLAYCWAALKQQSPALAPLHGFGPSRSGFLRPCRAVLSFFTLHIQRETSEEGHILATLEPIRSSR